MELTDFAFAIITDFSFVHVNNSQQIKLAGQLIREYLSWLLARAKREYGITFDVEAMVQEAVVQEAIVQSDTAPNNEFQTQDGRCYLLYYGKALAGVGCLKKLDCNAAELQRMYVRDDFRGKGLGKAITKKLIQDARQIGYKKLRLESLGFLSEAHTLYESLGFQQVNPYDGNSMELYQDPGQLEQYKNISVFMEMNV